ncbi:hypothetical protein EJ08DRAFT_290332 [Tothia fuscella]|uniref:EthD domain-containing protein n=1 Tax=Tothia fuscella TaxID=1048955 RepID=A0A9P4U3D6_9PEZI|nr:hypothetical protein EJ08DRAFT_290332 [Tothia fuscella]
MLTLLTILCAMFLSQLIPITMSSPTAPSTSSISITYLLPRNSSLTFPAFKSRYAQHMKDVTPILKKHNCTHYSVQLNEASTHHDLLQAFGSPKEAAEKVEPAYDAITVLKFPSLVEFKAFMDDQQHKVLLKRDDDMTAQGKVVVVAGEEVVGI